MDYLDGISLKEHRKGNRRPQNQMGRENSSGIRLFWWSKPLKWEYDKMNELLEVIARIGLRINIKKTKSIRLRISENENVTLGNVKIDPVGSFTYLGSIFCKEGGSSEDDKIGIAKAKGVLSQLKKSSEELKDNSANKTWNIGSSSDDSCQIWLWSMGALKSQWRFNWCFQRNCLKIVLGTRLANLISNSRLYKKCGSIPLSRAIVKERLIWLGHVLWLKDNRLQKKVLFGQPSRAKQKTAHTRMGWEDVINKNLKEMGTFWDSVKRETLNRFGWRRNLRLCWPQKAWCCGELLVSK